MKLMQRVKIAHSILQSVSNLFHLIILSLLVHMTVKEFFETTSKNGDIGHFNRSLLIEAF